MKVEELRIGNYFYVEKSSCLFDKGTQKVKFDTFNDIRLYNALESMKPIELTEEILLKCGFKKETLKPSNEHSEYFSIWIEDYKYSFSFAYFRNNWGFYHSYTDASEEEDNNRFDAISFGIKYLHQLQNLYWCLTNEELQINL